MIGLWLCLLASVALLRRLPGASPWWLAGTPAIAYFGALNWDLLPIALLLAAVLAAERDRPAAAGALAGARGLGQALAGGAPARRPSGSWPGRRRFGALARAGGAFLAVTLLAEPAGGARRAGELGLVLALQRRPVGGELGVGGAAGEGSRRC